jgi:hypothetical protein
MVEIEASIAHLHLPKSAIDREIGGGTESGRIACPHCPHDGQWNMEVGGWLFSCDECGVSIDGRFSPVRSVN